MPNMVVMPKTLPVISFADKVKQMVLTEATTKAQAAAERIRKQQEDQREQFERERYTSLGRSTNTVPRQEDSWDTSNDDGWTPGTPEFGREEFLHDEEDNDWSNT